MPSYRIYRLSGDNRIVASPEIIEKESDQEIIAHAKEKQDGLNIEIWEGPRLVFRLKAS